MRKKIIVKTKKTINPPVDTQAEVTPPAATQAMATPQAVIPAMTTQLDHTQQDLTQLEVTPQAVHTPQVAATLKLHSPQINTKTLLTSMRKIHQALVTTVVRKRTGPNSPVKPNSHQAQPQADRLASPHQLCNQAASLQAQDQ